MGSRGWDIIVFLGAIMVNPTNIKLFFLFVICCCLICVMSYRLNEKSPCEKMFSESGQTTYICSVSEVEEER